MDIVDTIKFLLYNIIDNELLWTKVLTHVMFLCPVVGYIKQQYKLYIMHQLFNFILHGIQLSTTLNGNLVMMVVLWMRIWAQKYNNISLLYTRILSLVNKARDRDVPTFHRDETFGKCVSRVEIVSRPRRRHVETETTALMWTLHWNNLYPWNPVQLSRDNWQVVTIHNT